MRRTLLGIVIGFVLFLGAALCIVSFNLSYLSLQQAVKQVYACAFHQGKNTIVTVESAEWQNFRRTLTKIFDDHQQNEMSNAASYFYGDWDEICPINLADTTLADFAAHRLDIPAAKLNWQRGWDKNAKDGFGVMFLTYPGTAQYFSMIDTGIKLVEGDCVYRRDHPQIGVIKLVEKNTAKYHEYEEIKGIYITTKQAASE